MHFFGTLSDSLEHLEIYHLLDDEMSKYKTLNHEYIKWDKVYEYSLEILQKHSMDIRICNHFALSCIALNNAESFETMSKLFAFLANAMKDSPNNLCKNANDLNNKKRQLKNVIEHFIAESRNLNISNLTQTAIDLNNSFKVLGEILSCNFQPIYIRPQTQQSESSSSVKPADSHLQSQNPASLNDREHRIFFSNLAFELLAKDNLNAYALFVEAMWGRITSIPPHNDNVTKIKEPDKHLIQILLQNHANETEHIKLFMSNLTLNPFWFGGLKIFCEFLEKSGNLDAASLLRVFARNFLARFKEIINLKFDNRESLCKEEVYHYFSKQDSTHNKTKANIKKQNIDEALLDINAQNQNNSSFHSINALLKMAKLFEERNMHNNAKILYKQLKDIMEKMLLKDYLKEDYISIKTKIEKV